jgi:putative mycofactocin binding protein MftB
VALRPEPFGAMAYHYDNRRLNFLRSADLVALVERLGDFETAHDALRTLPPERRSGFADALARLAAGDFLEPVGP